MPTFRTNWQEDKAKARKLCEKHGLTLSYYNPGGGTKVRIHQGVDKDWFDSHALLMTDGRPGGFMQARIFMEGYDAGASAVALAAATLAGMGDV